MGTKVCPPSTDSEKIEMGEIDTRAPFESVKAAVSLFGEVRFSSDKSPARKAKAPQAEVGLVWQQQSRPGSPWNTRAGVPWGIFTWASQKAHLEAHLIGITRPNQRHFHGEKNPSTPHIWRNFPLRRLLSRRRPHRRLARAYALASASASLAHDRLRLLLGLPSSRPPLPPPRPPSLVTASASSPCSRYLGSGHHDLKGEDLVKVIYKALLEHCLARDREHSRIDYKMIVILSSIQEASI